MEGYLALGSNLGDREENLRRGLAGLFRVGVEPVACSSVWETEPVNCSSDLVFLNMVVRIEASGRPGALLQALLSVEREVGRVRSERNAPRTLDIDLLLFGDLEMHNGRLALPHPRMWRRRFVLAPLAELAPDIRNPATGRSVVEELNRIEGQTVRQVGPLPLVPSGIDYPDLARLECRGE